MHVRGEGKPKGKIYAANGGPLDVCGCMRPPLPH